MKTMQRRLPRWTITGLVIGVAALGLIRAQVTTVEDARPDRLYQDYVRALELVRDNHVLPANFENLNTAAVSGMLRTLDPHSNFYDRKSFEEMKMEQRSQYYGIGATIQRRYGGVYIIEPFRNTPAQRAGLRYGDRIISIDGKSAEALDTEAVRGLLRGKLGTGVQVTVERAGVTEPVVVNLERGAVDLPSISSTYLLRPGLGYIALGRGFHSTTSEELNRSILFLKSSGMGSLILDLRGNPGGFLDQAISVADKFLARGQKIVVVRGRTGRSAEKDWVAESGSPESFPLIVLIDDGSASASEIVAGAIQDHDRGLIIGEPSFGKGLVQTIFTLRGGAGLTLTTARYYTPSGRLIQRDYSSGSIYEYLSRRGKAGSETPAEKATPQTFRTDRGRTVYGGGGIEPDITIKPDPITSTQSLIWSTGLFYFTRELIGGKIAGASEFKLGPLEVDHEPRPGEFVVTEKVVKAFQDYLAGFIREHPETGLTAEMVKENLSWAQRRIREEVLIAAYGSDVQRRMTVENDPQLQRAIAEIPQATKMVASEASGSR